MKKTLFLAAAFVAANQVAGAQSSDVGTLWRGPTPVVSRVVDSSAAKRVADSVKASKRMQDSLAAKRKQDSVSAKRVQDSLDTKRVQDSLAARASSLDKLARSLQDSIARLSAKLVTRPETAVVKAAPTPPPTVTAKPAAPAAVVVPTAAPTTLALAAKIDSLQAAQKAAAKQAADAEQKLTQKIAGLGNFRFSGDVRVRYEGQSQDAGFVTRHRERSRARLTATGNVTDELSGAISIATGALDDVQSANQTQTGFFSRKAIGFDRFYLTWKPKAGRGISVTAGKFPYTWERTSLTFGNDINPEGVATSWTLAHKGVFQGVTLTGFALPFFEVAGDHDSYLAGGQLQTRWKLGAKANARLSVASLSFHGEDAIAQAAVAGTIKPASANTNRVRTDSAGKIIGYATSYGYQDAVATFDYTATPRVPVVLQLNMVRNPNARSGEGTGIYSDLRVGRLSQARDVQVAWTRFKIERDAVIGAFNEQDLRAATNVLNHRFTVAYQWRGNATIGAGLWLGRLIEPSATGKLAAPDMKTACTTAPFVDCRDPWFKRLQLDLSYKF